MNNHNWPKIRKRKTKVKGHQYSYYVVDLGVVDGIGPARALGVNVAVDRIRNIKFASNNKERNHRAVRMGFDLQFSSEEQIDAPYFPFCGGIEK